jgi:hypothetical protein
MADRDELDLEPGTREARLYDVFMIDLWWSLGLLGVGLAAAAVLFAVYPADALRVAGWSVGIAMTLTFAVRLLVVRGPAETHADEWLFVVALPAVLVAGTEAVNALLRLL